MVHDNWNLLTAVPQGTEIFSIADRFRFIQVREVLILGTAGPGDCKSFPLVTGFRYVQVPFKADFTVIKNLLNNPIFLLDFWNLNQIRRSETTVFCSGFHLCWLDLRI